MTRPSYDEIRAEAEPCLGGCGKLVTHPPRYCNKCAPAWRPSFYGWRIEPDRFKRGQPDTQGGME